FLGRTVRDFRLEPSSRASRSRVRAVLPAFGAVPVPARQWKVVRHVVGRGPSVVEQRSRPREPGDELESQAWIVRDTGIVEREHERGDTTTVHLFMRAV